MSDTIETLEDLRRWVEKFLARRPEGSVVGLSGDLGAGKTTLVRTAIEIICAKSHQKPPVVRSPSFVLHQNYSELNPPVDHFDLYRLDVVSERDLASFGYFDVLEASRVRNGFVFVEWPEKAKNAEELMLKEHLKIELRNGKRLLMS